MSAKELERTKLCCCLAKDEQHHGHINTNAYYISQFENSPRIRTVLENMYVTRPPFRKMTMTFYYLQDGEKVKLQVKHLVIQDSSQYITVKIFL